MKAKQQSACRARVCCPSQTCASVTAGLKSGKRVSIKSRLETLSVEFFFSSVSGRREQAFVRSFPPPYTRTDCLIEKKTYNLYFITLMKVGVAFYGDVRIKTF